MLNGSPLASERLPKYCIYTMLEKIAFSLELFRYELLKKNGKPDGFTELGDYSCAKSPAQHPPCKFWSWERSGHKIRMPNIQTTSHPIHNGTT